MDNEDAIVVGKAPTNNERYTNHPPSTFGSSAFFTARLGRGTCVESIDNSDPVSRAKSHATEPKTANSATNRPIQLSFGFKLSLISKK